MVTQVTTAEREVSLVKDAHIRRVMGFDILVPLPPRTIPYSLADSFSLSGNQ